MNPFRQFLENIAPLTEEHWNLFSSRLFRQEVSKKSMILKAGQVEDHVSFVEKGTVRFFVSDNESKETTFAFIFEHDLVCAYDSFLTRQPCNYYAQALTHTVLYSISYEDLQHLYAELPVSNVFGRILSEEIYLKKAKRELSLLNESAEERYLNIFSERPNLIKHIPLKYIASYIGVTPQALSRIRRRIY